MNHRQWKKKFKKIHGRNPNCWEDKRKKIRYDATVLIDAINEIPRIFARACANTCEMLSEGFATVSKRMKEVAETYGRNEDERRQQSMKIEVGDEIWMKPLTHTMVVVTNLFEDGRRFDGIDRYGAHLVKQRCF